jgi:Prp8 binding protein/COMPASS component SWD3
VVPGEFLTGSHDKTVRVWDVTKDKSVRTLTGHKEGVWCIHYHNSGTSFITASPEGIAKLWDLKTGKPTADLKIHTKRVIVNTILHRV